jgi:hypothetical protein
MRGRSMAPLGRCGTIGRSCWTERHFYDRALRSNSRAEQSLRGAEECQNAQSKSRAEPSASPRALMVMVSSPDDLQAKARQARDLAIQARRFADYLSEPHRIQLIVRAANLEREAGNFEALIRALAETPKE